MCEKCAFSTPLETNLKLHKEAMHRVESKTTSSTRTNDNMDDDDEYPYDEEVAAFYAEQNKNRRRRTNPQSDAPQTSKQTENQSKFVCSHVNSKQAVKAF